MDSEEDTYDNVDSGNESSGDDVDFAMEVEVGAHREKQTDADDYPFEVLSTEEIVQHMVDCIREVNSVVEVLNHIIFDFFPIFEHPASDTYHHNSDTTQSFSVGQRKTHGALL